MSKRIPPRLAGWDLADESVRLKIDDVAGESGEDATIRTLSHSLDAHQELGYFQTENPASTPAFNVHYAHLIRTLAFEEASDFGRTFKFVVKDRISSPSDFFAAWNGNAYGT